ncbi:uncharacterized protein G2W53_035145 [Senna tora]|uniref:Uncharacterized protein n=1 Tax=Senna tora TaxID=362788 RepID=A0A834W3Q4_9FABA|nr:uncharacterized protein G2W53_035145 [Senna tora]
MPPPTSTTASDPSRAANASSASGTIANNFATTTSLLSTPSSTTIFSLTHYRSVLQQPICVKMASSAFVADLDSDSPPIASFLVLGSVFNLHHPFFKNSPPPTTSSSFAFSIVLYLDLAPFLPSLLLLLPIPPLQGHYLAACNLLYGEDAGEVVGKLSSN